jgi:hypothetical protein
MEVGWLGKLSAVCHGCSVHSCETSASSPCIKMSANAWACMVALATSRLLHSPVSRRPGLPVVRVLIAVIRAYCWHTS